MRYGRSFGIDLGAPGEIFGTGNVRLADGWLVVELAFTIAIRTADLDRLTGHVFASKPAKFDHGAFAAAGFAGVGHQSFLARGFEQQL